MLATDAVVDTFCPWVISKRRPSTLDKNRSRYWVATLGDAAIAIRFTGLVLTRNQAEVSGYLAAICEAIGIIDTGDEDLGSSRPNTRDSFDSLDTRISLADGLKLLDDDIHLRCDCVELSKFVVEFAFPEFVWGAISNWFTEGINIRTSGMPRFFARVDGDPVIDEPSTNGAFHFADPAVEGLSILH